MKPLLNNVLPVRTAISYADLEFSWFSGLSIDELSVDDTPEQQIGSFQIYRPWETCMTICQQWAWKPDDKLKSTAQCIRTLIRTAGGDGNLLFNVGPMPDGQIESRQVDRLKDMVVSGGVNIYTKEVEDILYEHPEVLEAAVYGLPDEKWGEQVTAAVVLRPKAKVSAEGLAEHCNKYLAGYKRPRAFYFLENLPKNPSGKILKRDLRTLQGQQS